MIGEADCGCAGQPQVYWCNLLKGHCTVHGTGKPWRKISDVERVGRLKPCSVCERRNELTVQDRGQQPLIDSIVAVTSISSNPKRIARQQACLDSWKAFGLSIYAKNTESEIERLKPMFPQVDFWLPENELSSNYSVATQLIRNLAYTAIEIDRTILVINSDIEIYGRQEWLLGQFDEQRQYVGIRWNYDTQIEKAVEFEWGLDAFSFTPRQAALIPKNCPLAIGQGMWDYGVPQIMRLAGVQLNIPHNPLLFHQNHPQQWSQEGWEFGVQWLKENIGPAEMEYGGTGFRREIDPDWTYRNGRWQQLA